MKRLKYPAIILFTILVGVGLFFLGSKYALDHLSFRQITPTQVAEAMKNDHFWSSYRENVLFISGDVISVAGNGNTTLVRFKTDSTYGTECSFTNLKSSIKKNQTIKIITIANAAEREPSSIRLNECVLQ